MVCPFIDTLCKYTTCVMRSLKWSFLMLLVGGWLGRQRRLVGEIGWRHCDGRATCGRSRLTALRWPDDLWSKSTDGAALETIGSVALHWGSLDRTCCSVEPDEAGELIWLLRPAPVVGYITAYRTCRANTRTALLEMYVLTGRGHLAYWLVFRLYFCWSLEANPI
jgi:hypothetical protein